VGGSNLESAYQKNSVGILPIRPDDQPKSNTTDQRHYSITSPEKGGNSFELD